jgi:hypothetical protein
VAGVGLLHQKGEIEPRRAAADRHDLQGTCPLLCSASKIILGLK